MRFGAAIRGDLARYLAAEADAAGSAVTEGVTAASEGLRADLRRQVIAARLGERLARTWRSRVYPSGRPSAEAAGLVWSRAPKIVDAFDRGVTIRSSKGFFLAIPTPTAGVGLRGARITPGEWERRSGIRLRFVYRRGAPSLLVADNVRIDSRGRARANRFKRRDGSVATRLNGRGTAIVFVLLPQVTLAKRLDIDATAQVWRSRLPDLVVRRWREPRIGGGDR
jgi:hypothetical protein